VTEAKVKFIKSDTPYQLMEIQQVLPWHAQTS